MKVILIFLLLFSQLVALGQKFNYQKDYENISLRTLDSKDKLFYPELLERFESNDTSMTDFEVLALMIGFTARKEYNPFDNLKVESEIQILIYSKKFKEANEKASKYLKTNPVSQAAMFQKYHTLSELGEYDSSSFYLKQQNRILNAIEFSGNGKTINSPIFTLNFEDASSYISRKLGGYIGREIMPEKDSEENFIYVRNASFQWGETISLYFILQHATKKAFGEMNIEEYLLDYNKKTKKTLDSLIKSLD